MNISHQIILRLQKSQQPQLCCCCWIPNIRQDHSAFICRVKQSRKNVDCWHCMSLKMKALQSVETSGTLWPTVRHYIPEDLKLQQDCCTNVQSLKISVSEHVTVKGKVVPVCAVKTCRRSRQMACFILDFGMDVSGLFDISSALPWEKNTWYPLESGATRAVLNVMKKRKIYYHYSNCTLDRATLSLVPVQLKYMNSPFWMCMELILSDGNWLQLSSQNVPRKSISIHV